MVVARRRTITLAECLALPEEEPALEFLDGLVTQKPWPSGQHGALQGRVTQLINDHGIPRKLVHAFLETQTIFGGAALVPDVSVVPWERIPTDEGYVANEALDAPDVAVEIASPGQGWQKLLDRCRWYVQNGVRVALLIDPSQFTVTELRPDAEPRVYRRGQKIDLGDVVAGFSLSLDELFGALRIRDCRVVRRFVSGTVAQRPGVPVAGAWVKRAARMERHRSCTEADPSSQDDIGGAG